MVQRLLSEPSSPVGQPQFSLRDNPWSTCPGDLQHKTRKCVAGLLYLLRGSWESTAELAFRRPS